MSNVSEAVSNAVPIKWSEVGFQLLTALLITSAVGLPLLQLSVRLGMPAVDFDALTF